MKSVNAEESPGTGISPSMAYRAASRDMAGDGGEREARV